MINPISRFARYNINFLGNKTYVVGHKNPDADSVCSAIGVAHLQNQLKTDIEKEYQPITAGDINAETAFALASFGIEPPKVKTDVSLTVAQAMDKNPLRDVSIQKNASIREFIDLVMDKDIKTAPVVDDNLRVVGLVSRKSLAEFLIEPHDHLKQLKEFNIPYERLAKLINADVLCGTLSLSETIKGDVQTGAYSSETMDTFDLKDGIVVVGDREEIQQQAIKNGAKALIVTKHSPVASSVIELAKENDTIILSTNYGIAKVTSILEQAIPVSHIMSDRVIGFDSEQTVQSALETVRKTKFNCFPVLKDKKLAGMINREQILAPDNNGIILVDHNNPSQFVQGVNKEDIEGVVDHHVQQLVLDSTRVPITYMPVGATATLVARDYKVNGIPIPKDIAGILWCAIISDTDKFTSVTTTPEDKKIAAELAKIAEIKQPEVLANKLLAQRDVNLENLSSDELIKSDLKIMKTKTNDTYCIGQIKTYQSEKYVKDKENIEKALNELDEENNAKGSVLMVTDMVQGSTYLLVSDKIRQMAKKLVHDANDSFLSEFIYESTSVCGNVLSGLINPKTTVRLQNVQSRKEQVQPFISRLIEIAN